MLVVLFLAAGLCTLSEEVDTFLDGYAFNGYPVQWCRGFALDMGEPVSFTIYPGTGLEGVLCGAGGENVYNLSLELHGGGFVAVDVEPDDLPVLDFVTGDTPVAYKVTVEIQDMIGGALADSAYVFFAMRPVEAMNDTVPAQPDSAITGD